MTDPFAPPSGEPAEPTPAQPTAPVYGAPLYGEPVPAGARNGLGTAALVLGVLAVFPLTLLVVPGVLAVVFGVIGRRRVKRGEATNGGVALAGLICGVVSLAFAAAFIAVVVWAVRSDGFADFQDCLERSTTSAETDRCTQDFVDGLVGNGASDGELA